MSGIYGIFRFDGAPVEPAWLERMRAAMAYSGPDGGGQRIEGPVGLGHLLLELNPEDALEAQPVMGGRGPVVSAARLDNRDELLEQLGVGPGAKAETSDGKLVSLAFDRWGEAACERLQGDWSLAAWDAREHRLLLARDACGNATLYYYPGEGFVAFASSMKALLALPGVKREPDRVRLAQVLISWPYDGERTAYEGFRRLLWAQAMTVDAQGQSRLRQFWSPEGRELLRLRRDEEYVEGFLEAYTRAVRSCLRTKKPIAATLSGGRDSGSVVALAAPLLAEQGRTLTAYTSVPWLAPDAASEKRLGNEWAPAHATTQMAGENVRHLPVDAAGYGVIQGILHLLDVHDGPSHAAGNHYWMQAIAESAVMGHAGSILTGARGNAAVSWRGSGSALLALRQGRLHSARWLLQHAERSPWLTLKRQVLKPALLPAQGLYRRLRAPSRRLWRNHSALNLAMAEDLKVDTWSKVLKNNTLEETGWGRNARLEPRSIFFRPGFCIAAGLTGELGAHHGLTFLDPTANLALMEFILRVPDEQFRFGSRGSWLFQRAFQNRLPKDVLQESRKGLQASDIGHRICREEEAFRGYLDAMGDLPEAREMLDLGLLRRCLEELLAGVNPHTSARASQILLRGFGAGLFLLQGQSKSLNKDSERHFSKKNQ